MDSNENEVSIKRVRKPLRKNVTADAGNKRPFFLNFFAFLFFVVAVSLGYLYYKASNELKLLKNPQEQSMYLQKKTDAVIKEMSKYIVIRDDDKPVFAGTVEDPEALKKEQVFFADASVGDYIFVFEKTQRAILWNPTKKMVVNFGLFNRAESPKEKTTNTTAEKKTTTTEKTTDSK